jgi:tRNA pseudouridine55 synthase
VNRARRTFRIRRIGHTGTLDPFATGVLPLCLGRATRLARFLGAAEKVYRATIRVGFATTTDDLTGEPLGEPGTVALSEGLLLEVLARFVGTQEQVSPAYSARRVEGKRLYELARRGEVATRPARTVTIHAIDLVGWEDDAVEVDVRCSQGTYIRSLARDVGEVLGPGAHLAALRRTRSGSFALDQAVPGDDLGSGADRLVSLADALPELPAVRVGESGRERVRHGRELSRDVVLDGFPEGPWERVRIIDEDGVLLALAVPRTVTAAGAPQVAPTLRPDVVLMA